MEKLDIIKSVESILPEAYLNASIICNSEEMPLLEFLETKFINFVYENAQPENLKMYILNKLNGLIKLENRAIKSVNEFIKGNPNFKDIIRTSRTEVISLRNYMMNYALKNMNEEGYLEYAGKIITLNDLYLKLLANEYTAPSLEDKSELCIDMVSYIDNSILDSILDGMDITVRDYICRILPTKMDDEFKVDMNNQLMDIDTLVTHIVDHQAKYIEEQKEKELKQKEDQYNKTGDNPGLVSEIQVILNDNNLEITAEIPVVTSSLLTEEEVSSLTKNYANLETVSDEDFYMAELNNIKTSIANTNTAHDLAAKEALFKRIADEALSKSLSLQVQTLITSIDELITMKRNNIIKIVNNIEEYTDVLFSEINTMNDELNNATTLDEYSALYGKANERYNDLLNKGITDLQLRSAFQLLFKRISEKRLNLDSTIGYQSQEVERVKVELNAIMSDIKNDILLIEHNPNNLGNLTGTEIRLNFNIQSAKERVEKEYIDGLLTEDDREYYMNRLKGYSYAIQGETKIGYGLR